MFSVDLIKVNVRRCQQCPHKSSPSGQTWLENSTSMEVYSCIAVWPWLCMEKPGTVQLKAPKYAMTFRPLDNPNWTELITHQMSNIIKIINQMIDMV